MSPIPASWAQVENATRAWVVAGSSLPDAKVVWGEGGGPRPDAPCIALRIMGVRRRGHDWTAVEDASDPQPLADLVTYARGMRELRLTLQAFSGPSTGGGLALLHGVIAALRLPTVREALAAAGVGVGSIGEIVNVGGAINWTHFEPRAVLEVTLHVSSEVADLGTWIESVEIETEATAS
jgi:hypothetical protein